MEVSNANDYPDPSGLAAYCGATDVAVQQRVGLLPERRPRVGVSNHSRARVARVPLTSKRQPSGTL